MAVPQPLITLYVIITAPAAIPVTTPSLLMVATDAVPLIQLPPVPVELSVIVVPVHKADAPLMVPATGSGLTDTALVAVAAPQLLLTV